MSREIKFRVWDKQWGKMLMPEEWSMPRIQLDGSLYDDFGDPMDDKYYIIEQYTGGEDKNGQEIYEGDIVEEDIDFNSKMTDGTFRYKVYWNEDELYWSLDPIGPESIHNDLWELNSSCRVIGNIHENPELLGGEE